MTVFTEDNEVYKVLGGFFEALARDPEIGAKLLASKLKIRFNYREPDSVIGIDLSGDVARVLRAPTDEFVPEVEMSMKADTAHRFWHGQVNLVMALARREITAKGPIPKILKLLPIIKPSYALYGPYLKEIGFSEAATQNYKTTG